MLLKMAACLNLFYGGSLQFLEYSCRSLIIVANLKQRGGCDAGHLFIFLVTAW